MPQHWACTCLGLALYLSNQFARYNSSPYESCVGFFFLRQWPHLYKLHENDLSAGLCCVPSHARKISSCLALNVDDLRQSFKQSFLLEESATQHRLTTRINDQTASHQPLPFSVIRLMCGLLEALFYRNVDGWKRQPCVLRAQTCTCVCACCSFSAVHPSSLIDSSWVLMLLAIN